MSNQLPSMHMSFNYLIKKPVVRVWKQHWFPSFSWNSKLQKVCNTDYSTLPEQTASDRVHNLFALLVIQFHNIVLTNMLKFRPLSSFPTSPRYITNNKVRQQNMTKHILQTKIQVCCLNNYHPIAYFCVQLRAVASYLARSVLYMWAISGTRGSSGFGSVSNEQIESNTWFAPKFY